jgi:hypothetical protein
VAEGVAVGGMSVGISVFVGITIVGSGVLVGTLVWVPAVEEHDAIRNVKAMIKKVLFSSYHLL